MKEIRGQRPQRQEAGRSIIPYLSWVLCAARAMTGIVCDTAHGEIVLTNYSPSHPLTIMAVGDSITDDCSINGAWCKPLQPTLDTNGFPFTFVGRQSSTVLGAFTKVKHEGYCGAVVAPPGLFGAHQYSSIFNYLQKVVPDALTNAMPDVMLIWIGANDIGNGRDPFLVATNHMATLLNVIFSNAPNVNVILTKASRQEAYSGAIATNIPIYNAALQAVVNQRQALGQKVWLADLYSPLLYPSYFSDGLHPNSAGLVAAAREWFTRIQAITFRSDAFTTLLINGGADWKYNDSGQNLGTSWTQRAFDDSAWSNGIARFGYADPAVATTISFGPQVTNKYVTTYFRRSFVVQPNAIITNLNFRVAQSDGVVVYLNGQEVYRTNMPAGAITNTRPAVNTAGYYPRYTYYSTNVHVYLAEGTNSISAEVHLSSSTASAPSGVMGFDMELIASGYYPPPLSIALAPNNSVTLRWPLTNWGGASLYSTTNLSQAANWSVVTDPSSTNAGQISVTQSIDPAAKFFQLRQP